MRRNETPVRKMNWDVAIETVTLLAKHLRTYAPLIALVGRRGDKAFKQIAASRLATELSQDDTAEADVKKILKNLLGRDIESLDWKNLAKGVQMAWKVNRLHEVVGLCISFGLLENSDLANLVWVTENWKRKD